MNQKHSFPDYKKKIKVFDDRIERRSGPCYHDESSRTDALNNRALAYEETIKMLRDAPAVDAVPVVRCGECAHSVDMTDVENQCATCHWKKCKLTGKQVLENGFCNNGERKDGEK